MHKKNAAEHEAKMRERGEMDGGTLVRARKTDQRKKAYVGKRTAIENPIQKIPKSYEQRMHKAVGRTIEAVKRKAAKSGLDPNWVDWEPVEKKGTKTPPKK